MNWDASTIVAMIPPLLVQDSERGAAVDKRVACLATGMLLLSSHGYRPYTGMDGVQMWLTTRFHELPKHVSSMLEDWGWTCVRSDHEEHEPLYWQFTFAELGGV